MRTTLLRYILYTLSSLSLCVGILFYQTFYSSNTRFVGQQEVFIPSGANMEALMEVLSPYLESPRLFVWAAQMKGYSNRVRSGRYLLSSGASNQKLINRLRQKSDPVLLTFNNQERLENLAGRLAQSLESDSLSFLNAMRDTKFLAEKGFTLDNALAMYLPNSYEVFWDVSPKLFCERMYDEYKRFWTATRRNQAAQQGLSLVEVSILASIVHKETVQSAERAAVAGVYLNRLRRKMKLQADPTVIYALKKKYQNFDTVIKRVLYKDLKIASPFNTYKVKGIPPGPIAMPDISAITAVLEPQKHSYLYFVANPDNPGYHLFASSLLQHNRNKRKYTRWLNQKRLYR